MFQATGHQQSFGALRKNNIQQQEPLSAGATAMAGKKGSGKNNLSGSRTGSNQTYRVLQHQFYTIIDTLFFIIYYHEGYIEKIPNKGVMKVSRYYFSKTGTDDIYTLTINNLENVFAANTRFRYALQQTFRADKELMDYDSFLKEYKLKYIFSQSIKD